MGYRPQAYDDADSAATMLLDARQASLIVPLRNAVPDRPAQADKVKQDISVDEAAFRLAVAVLGS